jgi:membrane-bound lytic murein transglycosylase F
MSREQFATTLSALIALVMLCSCAQPRLSTGDLGEVQAAGSLRVIVRPGFFDRPPVTGVQDEQKMLLELAARLGVEIRWIQAPRHDVMLEWLREGRGDLVVSRYSPEAVHEAGFAGTAPIDWVEDLIVVNSESPFFDLGDLDGAPLHLHGSKTQTIQGMLDEVVGNGNVTVLPVPEEVPLEVVLRRVQAGRYSVTIVDNRLVEAAFQRERLRTIGSLTSSRPLVWAVRSTNTILLAALNDYLFAERVLQRSTKTLACRDLEGIRRAGVLRLVTQNSSTTCMIDRGGLEGFEYDLVNAFTRDLGLRLELAIPPPGIDAADWIEAGYGDIAALHEPVPLDLSGGVRFSRGYRKVDLVAVTSTKDNPIDDVSGLSGKVIAAARAVRSILKEFPLDPPPEFLDLAPGSDAMSALRAVSRGEADAAIVDSDIAKLELDDRPALALGVPLLSDVDIAWLLAPGAMDLEREVNRFLTEARRSGLIRLLARSELDSNARWFAPDRPQVPPGALTPYDDLLRAEARKQGLDWRLLASLMYEESRFDPTAVGPGGSAGLFQFMPFTWRELGVVDPHSPEESARAGAEYLRRLMDGFSDVPLADQMAMAIASYNVGPRHVVDARRLATDMDLDRYLWSGNVETAMLILDEADVARNYPAGVCRCRRAVGYTRRILRRYHAYAEQFPPM